MQPWLDDLTHRRQAWEALSSLFLDTDIACERNWRASALAPLPYSVEQLEQILLDEVRPACALNLWVVAGEWAGFDPQWLEERIRRQRASRLRWIRNLFRWWRPWFWPWLWPFDASLKAEWQATGLAITALRAASQAK